MSSPVAPMAGLATGAPGLISGNLISVRLVRASTGLAGSVGWGAIATFGAATIGAIVGVALAAGTATFEVTTGVGVDEGAAEAAADAVEEADGAGVAEAIAERVGVGVATGLVGVALGRTVGVTVGRTVGVGVAVSVGVGEALAVGVGVDTGGAIGSAGGAGGTAGGAGGAGGTKVGAPDCGATTLRLITICLSPTSVCCEVRAALLKVIGNLGDLIRFGMIGITSNSFGLKIFAFKADIVSTVFLSIKTIFKT